MKTTRVATLLFLLFGIIATLGCIDDERLNRFCPNSGYCYVNETGGVITVRDPRDFRTFNVVNSVCELGHTECDPDTGEIICVGYKPPELVSELEVCDNIDNDCNFETDEDVDRSPTSLENTCTNNAGNCLQMQKCVRGEWFCDIISPDACGEEICDGYDNDGDGLVDEEDPDLFPNGPEFYWPEDLFPINEISLGPNSGCSPGRVRCIEGKIFYENLQTPNEEQCGDLVDNDCDGVIDENENPNDRAAYVFVIDVSSSMNSALAAAATASCNFSMNSMLSNSYFAAVFVGFQHGAAGSKQIILGMDFDDSNKLCAYLTEEPWAFYQGGNEYQPEGIMAAFETLPFVEAGGTIPGWDTGAPTLRQFTWPEDLERRIIVFSDEQRQESQGFLIDNLIFNCLDERYKIGVFTQPTYHYQWIPIIAECGGFLANLHFTPYFMEQEMIQFLTGGC